MEDTAKTIEPTRAEELVLSLSEKLAVTASARNVYGEPIHTHGRTIVPVARLGYGLCSTAVCRDGDNVGGGSVAVVWAQSRWAISRSRNTAHNTCHFRRHVRSCLRRSPESALAICSEGCADKTAT